MVCCKQKKYGKEDDWALRLPEEVCENVSLFMLARFIFFRTMSGIRNWHLAIFAGCQRISEPVSPLFFINQPYSG